MKAEIITIGDEILDGRRVDTNTAWIGNQLTQLGIKVEYAQSITDTEKDIVDAYTLSLSRSDLVFSTGGLGPTSDDITYACVAKALGQELVYKQEIFDGIVEKFTQKGLHCPQSNKRQAYVPEAADILANAKGTAVGLHCKHKGKSLYVMPGVPSEMQHIFANFAPALSALLHGEVQQQELRQLAFLGLAESHLAEVVEAVRLSDISLADIRTCYTASFPLIHVSLWAKANSKQAVAAALDEAQARLLKELGAYMVAQGGQTPMQALVQDLQARGQSIAFAESITGGALSADLVEVPGVSALFPGSLVAYSNDIKQQLLGVDAQTLQAHGAVSEACVIEMARGARSLFGSDWAVALSGIAGPSGGSAEKPVGLCFMAVVGPECEKGKETVQKHMFRWDRSRNRKIAVYQAIKMVREKLGQA